MIYNLKAWLASYFIIKETEVESYFRNENVSGFLIMWTILEQKLFDGFVLPNKFETFSTANSSKWNQEFEIEFVYFHDRYQNKDIFQNLCHGDRNLKVNEIINSLPTNINTNDKLLFLLYVVYRYRNNIFHGNKGVDSWIIYSTQIGKCVQIMKYLLD